VGGRTGGQQGVQRSGATDLAKTGTAVQPASYRRVVRGGTLAWAIFNGAFNLDSPVRAATVREVAFFDAAWTTQNNRKRAVTQGFEMPYQVVSNNTAPCSSGMPGETGGSLRDQERQQVVMQRFRYDNGFPDFTLRGKRQSSIRTQVP